jgi:hypothetical protein
MCEKRWTASKYRYRKPEIKLAGRSRPSILFTGTVRVNQIVQIESRMIFPCYIGWKRDEN